MLVTRKGFLLYHQTTYKGFKGLLKTKPTCKESQNQVKIGLKVGLLTLEHVKVEFI